MAYTLGNLTYAQNKGHNFSICQQKIDNAFLNSWLCM